MTRTTLRQFGPRFNADGSVTFFVWAPQCPSLGIQFVDTPTYLDMERDPDGMFTLTCKASSNSRYWIRLPNGSLRPDPASRFQPEGVHGPSQLVDTRSFALAEQTWPGVPKEKMILYELHLGTFTERGTYQSAIERLDELVNLGVTGIELMPITQSAGERNWGYDGVNFYAPRNTYGSPEDLRLFVEEAHRRGLAVILDVVYNHFGPEGNYLHEFGGYISTRHKTVWGDTPNFDGDGAPFMRDFIVGNVLYWIETYQLDGLRLDAIHCMEDDSIPHIVNEIGSAVDQLRSRVSHEIHLIAESNVYDAEMLSSLSEEGHGYDALWCDDFLHSTFAIFRPGDHMSNRQYHPHSDMGLVLQRGFVFQGGLRATRQRMPLEPAAPAVELKSLIFAIQNHDFIGNHPQGRRLHQLTSADAHRAAAALLLLFPAMPMLFMGEEFASNSPFFFFADFSDPRLRTSVEEGRRREYPQHDWSDVDSPLSRSAFERSRIGDRDSGDSQTLHWYQRCIELRKQWQAAGLLHPSKLTATWNPEGHFARIQYQSGKDSVFALVRLHQADLFPRRLLIHTDGEILLFQNCEPVEISPTQFYVGSQGVIVGRGTIAVDLDA